MPALAKISALQHPLQDFFGQHTSSIISHFVALTYPKIITHNG